MAVGTRRIEDNIDNMDITMQLTTITVKNRGSTLTVKACMFIMQLGKLDLAQIANVTLVILMWVMIHT